jgi:hypothetical protein
MSKHNAPQTGFVGHETTDAEIGPLVLFAVFLAATVLACAVLSIGLYRYLDQREVAEKAGRYPLAAGTVRPLPPPPRLQTYPFDDIKAFRKEEARILDHYAWVNQNAGIVRIPIERAMEVLAEKGLPYRGATGATGLSAEAPSGAKADGAGADSVTPERAEAPKKGSR